MKNVLMPIELMIFFALLILTVYENMSSTVSSYVLYWFRMVTQHKVEILSLGCVSRKHEHFDVQCFIIRTGAVTHETLKAFFDQKSLCYCFINNRRT